MKKIIFFMLLIVFTSLVFAGNKHHIDVFDGHETITLAERDVLELKYFIRVYDEEGGFSLKESTQRIFIDKVNPSKGSVELSNFIEDAETPFYVRINKAISMVLDFEKDGIKDIEVSLINLTDNTVTLQLKELKETEEETPIIIKEEEEIKEEVSEVKEVNKDVPSYVMILAKYWEITAIVLLIILILVWNKRRIMRAIRRAMI